MGQSSRADLESIGRFSRRSGIPVGQLRHYHDVGLLQAAYVDPESGYRYYAAAQTEAAEVIALLRSIDMPVRDIQRLLANPSETHVREVLGEHRARLEGRITQVAARLESIDRIVKEGRILKQPNQASKEGFLTARIESVNTRMPTAERWQEMRAKLPTVVPEEPQEVHVVTLVAENGRRLPIWVGSFEGQAMQLELDGLKTERPFTYDLMLEALERYGVRIVRAEVLRIHNATFYGRVTMESHGKEQALDCRPSDALNLALRAGVPIMVSQEVLDEAGVDKGDDPDAA